MKKFQAIFILLSVGRTLVTGSWLVTIADIDVGGGRRFLDHSHPLCTKLHQAPSARVRGELFVAVVREYTHTYLESRFGERGANRLLSRWWTGEDL